MKKTDANSLQDPELAEFVGNKRQELFNLRFQHATGQLDNSARLGDIRREVARINTLLREREIAAHEQQQEA